MSQHEVRDAAYAKRVGGIYERGWNDGFNRAWREAERLREVLREHGQRDDPLCPDCGARAAIEVGYCDNCGRGIATSSEGQQ